MQYIQSYWRKLDNLKQLSTSNESNVRKAFEHLLENYGEEYHLTLISEYAFKPFNRVNTSDLKADGVLIDPLRIVHGWWEAKDEKDDLEKEIEAKLKKGYPSDNIIFEDTQTAVLLQNGQETLRCSTRDAHQLERLLETFFNYETPEVRSFKEARDKFLSDIPQVSESLKNLLKQAHNENIKFHNQALCFLETCKESIGEKITADHVDEMLIQHILTDQIFRAIFPKRNFHEENHLAKAIRELVQSFFMGETRVKHLEKFEVYLAKIRQAAGTAITSLEKQTFLKQVYEDFYTAYNWKEADKLGIVYTPHEAVRFMIEGCDWLAQRHFGKSLSNKDLDILDPCTGTGTFIVDVLDYLRFDKAALEYKYLNEIHANEISILPYYIACLNIEQTYYEITQHWKEFKGACFVNTLDNYGFKQNFKGTSDLWGKMTDENYQRIQQQNDRSIPIILGNPPYNANQQNENNNNKNDAAPLVDNRIKETYLKESTAQKTKLYDPYIRFFRWASDRLGKQGILAFITNRSYLDSRQADGLRKTFAKEFQEMWIVDLMSDVRKNPKISGTKHNIFGIQTGVAIIFLVRKENPQLDNCEIHYLSLDDFLPAIEKKRWLQTHHLSQLYKAGNFQIIQPTTNGLWLNQPTEDWSNWLPIASKDVKSGKSEEAIFKLHSLGVVTARDEWVYGFSKEEVKNKVKYLIDYYEKERLNFTNNPNEKDNIKWSRAVKNDLSKNIRYEYDESLIVDSLYRPFVMCKLYFSKQLNEMQYRQREIFPIKSNYSNSHEQAWELETNLAIGISGTPNAKPFQTLAVSNVPCYDLLEKTQFLPLYIYDKNGLKQENITDWALEQFKQHYDLEITKVEIFCYVYAVLHDPRYREKFAINLKNDFPHIPFHEDFKRWAIIGKQLIDLHINFKKAERYSLERIDISSKAAYKCRLKADKTNHIIEIDNETILKQIPPQAWDYQLGNRSALEWVLDQYKEKAPKDPTIKEKFNTYCFMDHKEQVIELLEKICTISIKTVHLIEQLKQLP
jgi:predicted helicase